MNAQNRNQFGSRNSDLLYFAAFPLYFAEMEVNGYLALVYNNAGARATIRQLVKQINAEPALSPMQRCVVVKGVHDLCAETPFAWRHMPEALKTVYIMHSAQFSRTLASALDTNLPTVDEVAEASGLAARTDDTVGHGGVGVEDSGMEAVVGPRDMAISPDAEQHTEQAVSEHQAQMLDKPQGDLRCMSCVEFEGNRGATPAVDFGAIRSVNKLKQPFKQKSWLLVKADDRDPRALTTEIHTMFGQGCNLMALATPQGSEALVKIPRTSFNKNMRIQADVFLVNKGVEFFKLVADFQQSQPHISNLKIESKRKPLIMNDGDTLFQSYSARLLRPYVNMSKAEFSGHLLDLKNGWLGRELTEEEECLLKADAVQGISMASLRVALKEALLARAFWVPVSDASLLKFPEDFCALESVRVFMRDLGSNTWLQGDLGPVVQHMMESKTIVISGPPNLGKTPLARAIVKQYVEAKEVQRGFVQTSTADSLRQVFVQGLMVEGSALVMDEWKPGKESQDAKASICDFIKCLTDVENAGALALRYSDIKFPPFYPRIITSQWSKEQWIQALITLPREDLNAVLKRVLFAEVTASVIPAATAAAFKSKRAADVSKSMAAMWKARGVSTEQMQLEFNASGTMEAPIFKPLRVNVTVGSSRNVASKGLVALIIGMPGSGKTTAMRSVFPPCLGLPLDAAFRCTEYNDVLMLGGWRDVNDSKYHFSGTDMWRPNQSLPDVITFVERSGYPFVVAEGNSLCGGSAAKLFSLKGFNVQLVYISVDPMLCAERRHQRATACDAFLGSPQGVTKMNSIHAEITQLSADATVIDGSQSRAAVARELYDLLTHMGMLLKPLPDAYWQLLDEPADSEQDRQLRLEAALLGN